MRWLFFVLSALALCAGAAAQENITGLHVMHWYAGGGGLCTASMSVADCSYRRLLMRHMKSSLQTCRDPLSPNRFSLAHRGVPLVYPEHTNEGYTQALALGAQWIECDVVATRDMELVCRHDQCDLAETTNILSIPDLAAKCSVPGKVCCAYDLTLAEYSRLCGVAYDASNPHLQLWSWSADGDAAGCSARPATLAGMAALVVAAGGSLIPEQKNCDLMCQAKLAAANAIPCEGGSPLNNRTCAAVVNAISDKLVETVGAATGWDDQRSIVQTFEVPVALYITGRYRNASYDQRVAFLFEMHGQSLQTDQADLYSGYYPGGYTTLSAPGGGGGGDGGAGGDAAHAQPSPPLGSPSCAWCVNGTSPGGWHDVMSVLSAGVEFAAPSTADLVRPVGSLMVASDWATWIAGNFSGVGLIGWTLERSKGTYGTSPPAPGAWPQPRYSVFDSVGWAYEEHTGVSALDYEDLLFMLYALRWDVPAFAGVFSDFPGSTSAFMNCVPKFEAQMPVSAAHGWDNPAEPYPAERVHRADGPAGVAPHQQGGYAGKAVQLTGVHVWRMFSGGGGLCGVAGEDETFIDDDMVPPTELRWGQAVASAAAASAASAAAAAAALKGGVGGVAVTLRPPQTQDLLLSPGGQLLVSPAKPHLARVTTSSLDCAYRRRLMGHIKNSLAKCSAPLAPSAFSVSHRGSPVAFPEHSMEGYAAAISMGAMFIECDVAVTQDMIPVCRHSQCDLHSTTDVLWRPELAAKCSVPFRPAVFAADGTTLLEPAAALCCTFDFTADEFASLCAVQDIGGGWPRASNVAEYHRNAGAPYFRSTAFDSFNPAGGRCLARTATLQGMSRLVLAAGRNLIPEQKNCDLLCQAKLVSAHPGSAKAWGCEVGVYCRALVNAWSDVIVAMLNSLTGRNAAARLPAAAAAGGAAAAYSAAQLAQRRARAPGGGAALPGYILQTFELDTALYVLSAYPEAVVCFLYQRRGADLSVTQADTYLGHYPAALGLSAGGRALPELGGACLWCGNGTSAGGWADVHAAAEAGGSRVVGGISLSDLTVPQGSLMVASAEARAAASRGLHFVPWTLERSSGTFGAVQSAAWPEGSSENLNAYASSVGGYYLDHQGASALDYEDMLFMMYALRHDVPNVIGVFSDYPGTTTAFGNCVPKMDAVMPVNHSFTWNGVPTDGSSAAAPPRSGAALAWQLPGIGDDAAVSALARVFIAVATTIGVVLLLR